MKNVRKYNLAKRMVLMVTKGSGCFIQAIFEHYVWLEHKYGN